MKTLTRDDLRSLRFDVHAVGRLYSTDEVVVVVVVAVAVVLVVVIVVVMTVVVVVFVI